MFFVTRVMGIVYSIFSQVSIPARQGDAKIPGEVRRETEMCHGKHNYTGDMGYA